MKKILVAIIGISLIVIMVLSGCVAHGGGWFTQGENRVTFGFNTDEHTFTLIEHSKPPIKLKGIIDDGYIDVDDDGTGFAVVYGYGKYDGNPTFFKVIVEDNGEGGWGTGDEITVYTRDHLYESWDVLYQASIEGGNLQVESREDYEDEE